MRGRKRGCLYFTSNDSADGASSPKISKAMAGTALTRRLRTLFSLERDTDGDGITDNAERRLGIVGTTLIATTMASTTERS